MRSLGVDVGGVDLRGPLASFVRAPRGGAEAWREAAILEVNALPALHYHALPTVARRGRCLRRSSRIACRCRGAGSLRGDRGGG